MRWWRLCNAISMLHCSGLLLTQVLSLSYPGQQEQLGRRATPSANTHSVALALHEQAQWLRMWLVSNNRDDNRRATRRTVNERYDIGGV